jgi:hypothetical protein
MIDDGKEDLICCKWVPEKNQDCLEAAYIDSIVLLDHAKLDPWREG